MSGGDVDALDTQHGRVEWLGIDRSGANVGLSSFARIEIAAGSAALTILDPIGYDGTYPIEQAA